MALKDSYKLDWGGGDRVSVTFTDLGAIQVRHGSVMVGPYTEGTKPDGECFELLAGDHVDGLSGTVGLYNSGNVDTDVRILEYER